MTCGPTSARACGVADPRRTSGERVEEGPMNRRSVSLLAAAMLTAGLAVSLPATAAPAPNDATWTEAYFPSDDGTVLHADVLLPKNRSKSAKHPVIVSIGPYFGTGSQGAPAPDPLNSGPSNRFGDLWKEGRIFEKGY